MNIYDLLSTVFLVYAMYIFLGALVITGIIDLVQKKFHWSKYVLIAGVVIFLFYVVITFLKTILGY